MAKQVTIRVWLDATRIFGHVSLQTGDARGNNENNGVCEEGIYVSIYPAIVDYTISGSEYIARTLDYDLSHNSVQKISEFTLSSLDVDAIEAAYKELVAKGFNFSLFASTFFADERTHNCVGIVYYLLKKGGIDSFAENVSLFSFDKSVLILAASVSIGFPLNAYLKSRFFNLVMELVIVAQLIYSGFSNKPNAFVNNLAVVNSSLVGARLGRDLFGKFMHHQLYWRAWISDKNRIEYRYVLPYWKQVMSFYQDCNYDVNVEQDLPFSKHPVFNSILRHRWFHKVLEAIIENTSRLFGRHTVSSFVGSAHLTKEALTQLSVFIIPKAVFAGVVEGQKLRYFGAIAFLDQLLGGRLIDYISKKVGLSSELANQCSLEIYVWGFGRRYFPVLFDWFREHPKIEKRLLSAAAIIFLFRSFRVLPNRYNRWIDYISNGINVVHAMDRLVKIEGSFAIESIINPAHIRSLFFGVTRYECRVNYINNYFGSKVAENGLLLGALFGMVVSSMLSGIFFAPGYFFRNNIVKNFNSKLARVIFRPSDMVDLLNEAEYVEQEKLGRAHDYSLSSLPQAFFSYLSNEFISPDISSEHHTHVCKIM